MSTCSLRDLLKPWHYGHTDEIPDLLLNEMVDDSREIQYGDLFIGLNGYTTDGRKFISQAVAQGAVAILAEADVGLSGESDGQIKVTSIAKCRMTEETPDPTALGVDLGNESQHKIPLIYFKGLRNHLSSLANRFYNNNETENDDDFKIIGVTGTNGKTSVTHLLAQWYNLLNNKNSAAIMGTLGIGTLNKLKLHPIGNTTASAIENQKQLAKWRNMSRVDCSVDFVAMEVTSHGLVQKRVADVKFTGVIFTNLTHDHLDYHKTMEEYEKAKSSLFSSHRVTTSFVINADDNVGWKLLQQKIQQKQEQRQNVHRESQEQHEEFHRQQSQETQVPEYLSLTPSIVAVGFTRYEAIKENFTKCQCSWLTVDPVSGIEYLADAGLQLKIESSDWGNGTLCTKLLGTFNITNILLSVATLLTTTNYTLNDLIHVSPKLTPIIGRMELFSNIKFPKKPTIIIDYAPNPDSIECTLKSIRKQFKWCQNIWCIFGCGGDRDNKKRSEMTRVATENANFVILTTDNCRDEDQQQIFKDMLTGIDLSEEMNHNRFLQIIENRFDAISYAFQNANCETDIIVAMGKGHEKFMLVKNIKIPDSDRDTANILINNNSN